MKRNLLQAKRLERMIAYMNTLSLTKMSDAELDELSSGIAYARSQRGADYSRAELDLWDTIQTIFNRKQSIDHFVRGADGGNGFGVATFRTCAQTLEAVINKACKQTGRPDRAMRVAMRILVMRCLSNWLKISNVPPSPRSLLANIEKLEYAVDQEYPGYIEAGILSFVLTPLPQTG